MGRSIGRSFKKLRYICACTRNWVALICSPPSHYCLIFHLCVSVNFYPLCELDTIGSGRMDLIITYSSLPPNLTRCTSSQILLLATFHCQVLHKCILPCILLILESRGKEIHKHLARTMHYLLHMYSHALESFGSCGPK